MNNSIAEHHQRIIFWGFGLLTLVMAMVFGGNRLGLWASYNPKLPPAVDSELTGPGLTGPGLTDPGLTGPGLTSPGLIDPGLANSELGPSITSDFSDLRITEIMFDPAEGTTFSGSDYEFIELHNQGATALDMGGITFSDGISFAIPPGTQLDAGGFLIIAINPTAYEERYGVPPDNTTGYSGKLSNSGETVALSNTSGVEFLSLAYETDAAHLQLANGGGFSIVPIDPTTAPLTANDWRVSSAINGSPGEADAPPAEVTSPPVKVNEVLAHTDLPQIDFIELYNPTDEVADISGWYITDKLSEPTRFRVPFGTQIAAQGYLFFTQDQLEFAFFSEGDSAYLLAADAAGNLTGYSHGFDFGVTPNGVSLGRCVTPNGAGGLTEKFPLQKSVTRGTQNGFPQVSSVVISEINYTPSNGDEFIELTNHSSASVSLFDTDHPENLWKIDGIGIFTFTMGTVLPANSTLLVTSIEPSLFRSRYSIPVNVPIQGPYSGQLSDNGEKVILQRPDKPNTNNTIPYIDIDLVDYATDSSWPSVSTGNRTLERIALDEFGDSPTNWRASTAAGGTPGDIPTISEVRAAQLSRVAQPHHVDSIFLPFISAGDLILDGSCFTTGLE